MRKKTQYWLCSAVGAALLLAGAAAPAAAQDRYLREDFDQLGYVLPQPPSASNDPATFAIDIAQIRAWQQVDTALKNEAFEDADAFDFNVLLPRFSAAAGETLTITRRPILAHMLQWSLNDTKAYGDAIKAEFPRGRPYVVDPTIRVCDLSYIRSSDEKSYPSGHATNGFVAGRLLEAVAARAEAQFPVQTRTGAQQLDPARPGRLLARGVRYGLNRMICGAHFPSDVVGGQRFGDFLFARIAATKAFQDDLTCAVEEELLDQRGTLPTDKHPASERFKTADCASRYDRYADQMRTVVAR